jgi:hypothetical protein
VAGKHIIDVTEVACDLDRSHVAHGSCRHVIENSGSVKVGDMWSSLTTFSF